MKILKVEQPGQSTHSGPVLRLQTGQRLAAIALTDAKPGDRAMLSVAGGQLQVTTQHPLKAGQAIDLEVTRLGQQVHLRPSGPPPDPRRLDQAQLTRNLLQALARTTPSGSTGGQGTQPSPATPAPPSTTSAAPAGSPSAGATAPPSPATPPRSIQAFLSNQAASPTASEPTSRGTPNSTTPPTGSTGRQGSPPPPATPAAPTTTSAVPAGSPSAGAAEPASPARPPRSIQAFLSNQAASPTAGGPASRGAPTPTIAPSTGPNGASPQAIPAGLNGLVPLLSALREPRLIRGLVAGWLATQQNPSTQPNPLAGTGGPIPPGNSGLTETPLGAVLQQAARQLRARPDLAPRDPAARQATLEFMQRLGDQVERSQVSTALSQGAAGQAAGTHTGPNQPVWLLEIPLQLANEAHSLRMAIREDDSGPDGHDREGRWQIDLAMDWPQLGPVHAALILRGDRIDVDLFADRPGTVSVLETSRATLARGLEEAGLVPGRLSAYEGPPPASVQSRLEPDTSADDQKPAHGFLSEQA